jgi:hypothetical protein
MTTAWSDENTARLRVLWAEGHTGQEIADLFGDRTRSAVLGKVSKLNLPARPSRDQRPKAAPGQLLSKGYRKAYASKGDDPRARFVRVAQAPGTERKRRVNKARLPGFESPFIQEGRAKFPKAVQAPNEHILVSGHNNIKIGKIVRKGKLKGYWIYTLSLEERKTCPRSCLHWQSCYGNNMPFAKRVDHTHPDFLSILEKAVAKHCATAKKRGSGILVRLHALGDFYSYSYVEFWLRMLRLHANLAIYGYTARQPEGKSTFVGVGHMVTDIGDLIVEMNRRYPGRSMIRFSNGAGERMNTASIGSVASKPAHAFVCPEQTGKTLGCDTCALCWSTDKTVAFLEH